MTPAAAATVRRVDATPSFSRVLISRLIRPPQRSPIFDIASGCGGSRAGSRPRAELVQSALALARHGGQVGAPDERGGPVVRPNEHEPAAFVGHVPAEGNPVAGFHTSAFGH